MTVENDHVVRLALAIKAARSLEFFSGLASGLHDSSIDNLEAAWNHRADRAAEIALRDVGDLLDPACEAGLHGGLVQIVDELRELEYAFSEAPMPVPASTASAIVGRVSHCLGRSAHAATLSEEQLAGVVSVAHVLAVISNVARNWGSREVVEECDFASLPAEFWLRSGGVPVEVPWAVLFGRYTKRGVDRLWALDRDAHLAATDLPAALCLAWARANGGEAQLRREVLARFSSGRRNLN